MKLIRYMVLFALIITATTTLKAESVLLYPGQTLGPGEEVWAEGCVLAYQGDGNLVLYCDGAPQWATGTIGEAGFAAMQGDGNLVVYDAYGTPMWDSRTNGHDGAYLTVDNGNVALRSPSGYSKLWWGGLPPRWFPASAITYYEAGYQAYDEGHIDQLAVQWTYYYKTPGSECHWAFPAVLSILRSIAGHNPSISYLNRTCHQ